MPQTQSQVLKQELKLKKQVAVGYMKQFPTYKFISHKLENKESVFLFQSTNTRNYLEVCVKDNHELNVKIGDQFFGV